MSCQDGGDSYESALAEYARMVRLPLWTKATMAAIVDLREYLVEADNERSKSRLITEFYHTSTSQTRKAAIRYNWKVSFGEDFVDDRDRFSCERAVTCLLCCCAVSLPVFRFPLASLMKWLPHACSRMAGVIVFMNIDSSADLIVMHSMGYLKLANRWGPAVEAVSNDAQRGN
jgi:hypothetical protein